MFSLSIFSFSLAFSLPENKWFAKIGRYLFIAFVWAVVFTLGAVCYNIGYLCIPGRGSIVKFTIEDFYWGLVWFGSYRFPLIVVICAIYFLSLFWLDDVFRKCMGLSKKKAILHYIAGMLCWLIFMGLAAWMFRLMFSLHFDYCVFMFRFFIVCMAFNMIFLNCKSWRNLAAVLCLFIFLIFCGIYGFVSDIKNSADHFILTKDGRSYHSIREFKEHSLIIYNSSYAFFPNDQILFSFTKY